MAVLAFFRLHAPVSYMMSVAGGAKPPKSGENRNHHRTGAHHLAKLAMLHENRQDPAKTKQTNALQNDRHRRQALPHRRCLGPPTIAVDVTGRRSRCGARRRLVAPLGLGLSWTSRG